MKNKNVIWTLIVALVLIGLAVALYFVPASAGEYDEFATCLEEKEAKFFGTFWCPSCQKQKALFGKSSKKLPYIECSTPDGKSQLKECTDLGIDAYPTWEFVDGERMVGIIPLEDLAEKTGCSLPVL